MNIARNYQENIHSLRNVLMEQVNQEFMNAFFLLVYNDGQIEQSDN